MMKRVKWTRLAGMDGYAGEAAGDFFRDQRRLITTKPFLKRLYTDFYRKIAQYSIRSRPYGVYLEIGSGSGFMADVISPLITTDILPVKGVDIACSALALPFDSSSVDGLLLLNVFHHLPDAGQFLREASRCLKSGGRLILLEPANTVFARWIYRTFHHENFNPRASWYFSRGHPLLAANGALPWIVFVRDRQRMVREFPLLKIRTVVFHTPFRYLLSGGLSFPSLAPGWLFSAATRFEKFLAGFNPKLAMFMTIVVEKKSSGTE